MKTLCTLFVLLISLNSFALDFEVVGKEGQALLAVTSDLESSLSVGEITVGILEKNNIEFDGSELGIREMFELTNDLEILSKTEMKAWGWCFSINGEVPETLTHETSVESNESKIIWFYAYAHYLDGEWVSQCKIDY